MHGNALDGFGGDRADRSLGVAAAASGAGGIAQLGEWSDGGSCICRGAGCFTKEIAAALPVPRERQIGWVFHYFVGVVYGVFFAFLAGPDWIAAPTFPPAFIYALATIAGGWFLLHPGLGLGWAVSKVEHPNRVRMLGTVVA